jgi:hypothetical protein
MAGRRERPWRKVAQDLKFPAIGEGTPAAERDAHMAVHRLRLTEDLAHRTALAERDKPEEVAWSRMSRSAIRVSQAQLEQFGDDFRALVARYAELGAAAPDGEPTATVQLRLYASRTYRDAGCRLSYCCWRVLTPIQNGRWLPADGPPSPAGWPAREIEAGSQMASSRSCSSVTWPAGSSSSQWW